MDVKAIKRKVVEQLVEGYEFATQLQLLLSKKSFDLRSPHDQTRPGSFPGLGPGPADDLMLKILGSFDKTISVLGSFEPLSVLPAVEGSRNASSGDSMAAITVVSDARCEDSGESRKRPSVVDKGKRGCYKRKRKSQSWTVESNTLEDSHAWRKYGQKEILNAKYPRSYFRCRNKYTQGCRAVKQAQKLEHRPGIFQITYIGNHTCNPNEDSPVTAMIEPSEIVTEYSENAYCGSSSVVITTTAGTDQSSSKGCNNKQEDDDDSKIIGSQVKEEDTNGNQFQDLSLVWQDFMVLDDEHGELMNRYVHDDDMDDFMVFGRSDFSFGDTDQVSFSSDAYCV
ncbi:PREDICTED: probable WRKY transcription factor 70 [Tarenaya hassleriana]|uniref:probable WRKY transcription factor 70 n=1 Tax=Tarenaya hassleriana TaxID=28532 RepID=UPI00053C76AC|nr:PREDICTED: probable WRKY transcription factor 70 [Tarenaya hassleriana]